MRILFAFVGGLGHLEPLVPIARAAVDAGHTVAFTADSRMVPAAQARGFTTFRAVAGGARGGPPERRPLVAPDIKREEQVLRDAFAGRLARPRAKGILGVAAAWQPDVVVCDETDFGAAIAAERLGIPHATVLIGAAGTLVRPDVVAEPLDALRAEHGLPPDPALERGSGALVLSPFPASLRSVPLPPHGHALRLVPVADGATPGSGAIHFTLGTVVNLEAGDLFTRVLAGLCELGPDVVVTVGGIDPAELGPQPPHVRVERYVDLALLLPHCAAVVSHGGSGTLLGTLAHGLPSVLLPIAADQPLNARRAAELGLGLELDVIDATPDDVRQAAARVLDDPRYRRAAEAMRDEIAALPGPERAVELLSRL